MNLKWSKYSNPKYSKEDQSMIDCTLTVTDPPLGDIPFTASNNDVMEYGRKLYQEIIDNANAIPIAAYVPPPAPIPPASSGNNSGPTVI